MKTYILPLLAIVFYAPFLLIFMLELSSKKVLDVSKLPYKEMLFILGLIYPLGFFINITPSYGAFRLFSFFLSAGMMLFLYFSIFEQNSISTRQFIKYFFSLVPVYIICVYFSYYYSSYYSSVIGKTHFQREMFLIWTHLSFISVILAYLFYGVFSRYLANIFMKGYNSKDQKLREFALKMNPLQGFQNIFISFANNFESLMGFKIKASVFLHNDQVYVLSDGITREIKEDMQELKDAISQKVILPSEFFFRSTFHLLKLLKEYGIVQDFGYILPIHVKGEFDGFFITDPPPLSKKMVIARILPFMKYFKATVEKVMINADQLIHEKDIQDKILALEVKKRTSDEIKKKNTELQQALEKLKNKQKQLIDAEKWASICQVTVSLNHEINNPLTHIMGSSQMLKMQLQKGVSIKDKDLYDYLGKVEKQCQRIKTIIENLRKVSEPVAVDYLANTKMLNLRI
ncbi:MAG: hypothetical protein KAI43_09645 [Candidatus Aureabacteria bacterium]|nr:hypothetical protein [Candidatus Auribacterota bacterium]